MNSTNSSDTAEAFSSAPGDDKPVNSGTNTPAASGSISGTRTRSNTEETLVSTPADDDRSVASAAPAPPAPVNTPAAGSVVGDQVDATTAAARLGMLQSRPNSNAGSRGVSLAPLTRVAARGGVSESTMWDQDAEEMAHHGLKRLAQLARDENAHDSGKSVEQYYSEHLAKVIKEAELEFDVSLLQ